MDTKWNDVLWSQFGAAMDMLGNALRACPDELWRSCLWRDGQQESRYSEFWYVAYHALFWLDLYLTGSIEGFVPPEPFSLEEIDPAGLLPPRTYTRNELETYLQHGRTRARAIVAALTDEQARRKCIFSWGDPSYLELLLYTMRHVQEHAAQMNMFLGQRMGFGPGWVGTAQVDPSDQ